MNLRWRYTVSNSKTVRLLILALLLSTVSCASRTHVLCTEALDSTKYVLVRDMYTGELYYIKFKIDEGEIKEIKSRKLKTKL